MKHLLGPLAVVMAAALPAHVASQDEPDEEAPARCVAPRTDPDFAAFELRKDEWEARYHLRRPEFHPKMLAFADALGRCVERARRRDLAPNSRTTFGVQVARDGRVAKVAVLESNHANNLYGNCLARTLCQIELSPPELVEPEVFVFHFNMRRRPGPHQKPWPLDPLR